MTVPRRPDLSREVGVWLRALLALSADPLDDASARVALLAAPLEESPRYRRPDPASRAGAALAATFLASGHDRTLPEGPRVIMGVGTTLMPATGQGLAGWKLSSEDDRPRHLLHALAELLGDRIVRPRADEFLKVLIQST